MGLRMNSTYNVGNKFLKKTDIPQYAHAYMLERGSWSRLVDVTNDGVTSDDLGYWVRFVYRRTSTNYQWRDPFSQAHLQEGWIPMTATTLVHLSMAPKRWHLQKRKQNHTSLNS